MQTKSCTKCNIEKTIDQYHKANNGCLYGVTSVCKQCKTLASKEQTLVKNEGSCCEYPPPKHKKCNTCGIEKEVSEEYFRWSSKARNKKRNIKKIQEIHPHSRYQNNCRICEAKRQRNRYNTPEGKEIERKYREKNRPKIRERDKKYRAERLKDPEYAARDREKNQKKYRENKEKYLSIAKKYRENNREKTRETAKKHYWKNRETINKRAYSWRKRIKYSSSRRKRDPIYKLKCECRGRINWLTNRRVRVSDYNNRCPQTEKLIGCSVEFYYNHIEKQFLENMTWDNHGEWHIDHIVPLATAKTKEQVLELNKWHNLQPLWLSDNVKKGCKIPESGLYDYFTNEISEDN